jgi:hypothetical protein
MFLIWKAGKTTYSCAGNRCSKLKDMIGREKTNLDQNRRHVKDAWAFMAMIFDSDVFD